MAKRILVPLDRSDRTIVPVVAALARGAGAIVRLLRVLPVPEMHVAKYGRVISYVDQEMESLRGRAQMDLESVAVDLDGVSVESVVRFGDPVEEIALEAQAFSADLVAVGESRRGTLKSALQRGVSNRLGRKAETPVLVLRD
jgi:nucleotide-binding universal stress UspA family protein